MAPLYFEQLGLLSWKDLIRLHHEYTANHQSLYLHISIYSIHSINRIMHNSLSCKLAILHCEEKNPIVISLTNSFNPFSWESLNPMQCKWENFGLFVLPRYFGNVPFLLLNISIWCKFSFKAWLGGFYIPKSIILYTLYKFLYIRFRL